MRDKGRLPACEKAKRQAMHASQALPACQRPRLPLPSPPSRHSASAMPTSTLATLPSPHHRNQRGSNQRHTSVRAWPLCYSAYPAAPHLTKFQRSAVAAHVAECNRAMAGHVVECFRAVAQKLFDRQLVLDICLAVAFLP